MNIWICSECKEECEEQFESCWNCGSDKKGNEVKKEVLNKIKDDIKDDITQTHRYEVLKLFQILLWISMILLIVIGIFGMTQGEELGIYGVISFLYLGLALFMHYSMIKIIDFLFELDANKSDK